MRNFYNIRQDSDKLELIPLFNIFNYYIRYYHWTQRVENHNFQCQPLKNIPLSRYIFPSLKANDDHYPCIL